MDLYFFIIPVVCLLLASAACWYGCWKSEVQDRKIGCGIGGIFSGFMAVLLSGITWTQYSEITPHSYEEIKKLRIEEPRLQSCIDDCLMDDKITHLEMHSILEHKTELERADARQDLRQPVPVNQYKEEK